MNNNLETAIFGTGCFWCTEAIFKRIKGVVSTEVGYSGGTTVNPSYETVSGGQAGHAEVIKITFNPEIISFTKLLEVFWNVHDPTSLNKQGNDMGTQYRSIILYVNKGQRLIAEKAKAKIAGAVTEINKLDKFYPAEDYHSDYYIMNKNQPYCSLVITPKIRHLEEMFMADLK